MQLVTLFFHWSTQTANAVYTNASHNFCDMSDALLRVIYSNRKWDIRHTHPSYLTTESGIRMQYRSNHQQTATEFQRRRKGHDPRLFDKGGNNIFCPPIFCEKIM